MNPRLAEIESSLIRAINARKRAGDIDLGLGEPTLAPDLRPFQEAVEWTRQHGSPYSPNAGFAELRQAVAGYVAQSDWVGGAPAAENVCVTVGSEEALFLALKTVVDPARHEVLVVEPCYLAYAKICTLEGVRHRTVALDAGDAFRPDAAAVLAAVGPSTRVVVINSPCNPTGRVWAASELDVLARGLARRSGEEVFVLSDEVYRELHFGAEPPASPARFHPHTLVAGSLSKSNALTGLRLGWLAGPVDVIGAATKVHQLVNTAASTFAQRVALGILSGAASAGRGSGAGSAARGSARSGGDSGAEQAGSTTAAVSAHRPAYALARERLLAAAEQLGLELIPPEGAFYGFVRLPRPLQSDSVAAAEQLLEATRVVTVPGRAFGMAGEGWLRLSFVASPDALEEGLRRIAQWFSSRQEAAR